MLNVSASGATMTAALYPALRSGDVDASGAANAADLVTLANYPRGSVGSVPGGTSAADIDYSGAVNVIDLDTLIQMLANNL